MAAVAAVSTSFAQVSITGGVDFTFGKSTGGTKGFSATDAYIDVSATEDLGGGLKAIASLEFNADGSSWSTKKGDGTTVTPNDTMYGGDKSFTLAGGFGSVTLINTRSGGILNNILTAPIVSGTDHWSGGGTANVISRSNVDAVAILVPVAAGVTLGYKYVEGGDSYSTPLNVTHVLYGKYAQGPLTVVGEYNIRAAEYLVGDVRGQRIDLTAAYDAGVAKVAVGYESGALASANSSSSGSAASAMLLSVTAPLGNNTIGMNYGKRDAASFTEVGFQYNFSKQTFASVSYGTIVDQSSVSNDTFGIRVGKSF